MKYLNDISKDCVGKVCKSKSSGDFKIVKYNDCYKNMLGVGKCVDYLIEMKEKTNEVFK